METDDLFVDLFNPKTPKLEAIIFAEFDNDIGRVIKYQIPHDVFDKQKFETFSSAIIPSKEMQNRMIKINMYNYKIMADPKYDREYYMFNMCFVVAQDSQNDSIYEPVVQKLASYLVDLENESAFLSTSKQKDLLPPLMTKIFTELNEKGECVHEVSSLTTIYLKLCPSFHGREPPIVNPFMVPIFTRVPAPKTDEAINKMDVLSQKICPKIDGVRCIKDISKEVKIDPDLVGRCIQNLYFYGYISLLPMFLYSNIYTLDCSKKIRLFLENETMTLQCVKFVALKQDSLPLVNDVCRLYLSLKNGIKFKDWCLRMQPRQLNVDERKFIQFGIFYGFVRKLSIYPVAINPEEGIKMSEKPVLYSYWRSSCSWRVRIALSLKGVDYEYRAVNLLKGDQTSPEFLAQNPRGLVPLLISDGHAISESMAIIEYLDEKYSQKNRLLPEKLEDRAIVRSLAYAISSNIQPVQNLRVMKFYSKGEQTRNVEWAKHFIELGFDALEEELKQTAGKFSFGDTITLADLCIPPQVYNARRFSVDMSRYPTIDRIDKALAGIPEFQAAQPNRQPDAPEGERA